MIGDTIGAYRIESQLGRGGMGVVYKALDTKLDRHVAIKFIADHLTEDPTSSDRFIREARAAAGLNHPSICAIHEVNTTAGGKTYMVMPLYDGTILKDLIQDDQLPSDRVVELVLDVARGLEAAHDHDIVHRDIKPGNILVTESGRVVILDFGLAKLQGEADLTQTRSTVGTVAYMSPEQLQGLPTDHRTDIWSLGVLIFEMFTGERPFRGDFEASVIYSITNEEADVDRPDIPGNVQPVIKKMLIKDVAARYESIDEVICDLQAPSDAAESSQIESTRLKKWMLVPAVLLVLLLVVFIQRNTGTEIAPDEVARVVSGDNPSSLAVLPFLNVRPDAATDFLGYALADQVIGSLSYFDGLVVRPASAVRRYQDNDAIDLRAIGRELDVDMIMTGSFIQENDLIRLTVELVNLDTQSTIWRESIDAQYESTFKLQDDVAEAVVNRLEIEMADDAVRTKDVPEDPLAYEYYLRALAAPETIAGREVAIELVRQSIALDSTFAPAYDHLGFRLRNVGGYSLYGAEPIVAAERAFLRALELNPNLLSAVGNLAALYTESGRTLESVDLADRMLAINPNNAQAHFVRGYAFRYSGLIEQSVSEMRRAVNLDSKDQRHRSAGITFFHAHLYEEAIDAFLIDPESDYSSGWRGLVRWHMGDSAKAVELLQHGASVDPQGLIGLWSNAQLARLSGDPERAINFIDDVAATQPVDAEIWYHTAREYCVNEAFDRCARYLTRSIEQGYYSPYHLTNDPNLAAFRDTDRFDPILARAQELHAIAAEKLGQRPRPSGPLRLP